MHARNDDGTPYRWEGCACVLSGPCYFHKLFGEYEEVMQLRSEPAFWRSCGCNSGGACAHHVARGEYREVMRLKGLTFETINLDEIKLAECKKLIGGMSHSLRANLKDWINSRGFNREAIDSCNLCEGTGKVMNAYETKWVICHICLGYGDLRMKKR